MELPTKNTCEVKLRLSDVLDPFAYTSINLFNWFLTAIVCIVLYRPYWVFGPYSEEPWQDHVGFDMFICLAWSMFVGLPYLSLLIRFWKSPTLEKPRQFTFDAEGMHVESEDARGDYKWSLFRSVFEMKIFCL